MWWSWIFAVEAVLTVAGNVFTLLIFTRTPHLRVRKHFLIVNLAVADLLVGLISIPLYIHMLKSPFFYIYLYLYNTQDALFGIASVCGLAALAIERAYATYQPFKHRTLSKTAYIIGIAVTWIIALTAAISSGCEIFLKGCWKFRILFIVCLFLVLLVVIILSYTLIWINIICVKQWQHHSRRDRRLTISLLIVTLVSVISWMPMLVLLLYHKFCSTNCPDEFVLVYPLKLLHYGNSLVNPIIYALRMREFKTAIMRTFRCRGNPHL